MMKYVFIALLLCGSIVVWSQKPVVDTLLISRWPNIDDYSISPKGGYVSYGMHTPSTPEVLYLQSVDGSYKRDFGYGTHGEFTADGRWFIGLLAADSLCLVDLESRKEHYLAGVKSYKTPDEGDGCWLGYLNSEGRLAVTDLLGKEIRYFEQVQDFQFSPRGGMLLQGLDSSGGGDWLKWVNLAEGRVVTLCHGARLSSVTIDTAKGKVAFVTTEGEGEHVRSDIRLYQPGMDSATIAVANGIRRLEVGFEVEDDELEFSPDGEKLFFTLRRPNRSIGLNRVGASVDVWNYQDEYPQFVQLDNPIIDQLTDFRAVLETRTGRVIRLQEETDGQGRLRDLDWGSNADYLVTATKYNAEDGYWRNTERSTLWLVNTSDGRRKEIAHKLWFSFVNFSPGGKYLFWFDLDKQAYFTYNIRTGICQNISAPVHSTLADHVDNDLANFDSPFGVLGWLAADTSVLVYDQYDIWKVDPEGGRRPMNLTNWFGRNHHIILRGAYTIGRVFRENLILGTRGELTLCGLDERSKDNGFYQINVHREGNPVKLSMGPFAYYFLGSPSGDFPIWIHKAEQADRYLLTQSSATEFPNLVITDDFRVFKAITEFAPQRSYNWLSSELVRWKTFTGRESEGILYKPEDFDPKKKYPVIFNYYQRKGDGLHTFYPPALSAGGINIPWFVSRGYLVFSPDIRYTPGDVGAGVYDAVVSAGKMLQQKTWVNAKRMGLQGHSFGGFETNYLVTRTSMFAAAVSAAGLTNLIDFGVINPSHPEGFEGFVEYGQMRMLYTYWQRPDLYIRNSPVFHVNRVATPLLLMANVGDGVVQWQQGEELFMALRRLRKPVWLLQYDRDGHIVTGSNALDYTLRMTQFFDHFLKDGPEPKWMRESIPARKKGIEDGLDY
jgi:dipeptidyl aminopeptidase/acylaminoacyl peptidase